MASKNKSLITSFALTALVGICASLAACEVVDELPGDGDMGGENGDGDGDMGGAGGDSSTGGAAATGGAATGGQGTGGNSPEEFTCEFAESCADETILLNCYSLTANFQEEVADYAVECMNEGGCDESISFEACLDLAYTEVDLSEYEVTEYCDPGITVTCDWDTDEELACDKKIAGIQTGAQENFEECLVSVAGACDPTACTEMMKDFN